MQKWLKAAARYEASKQDGFKPRKKRLLGEKPLPNLAEFLANGEGEAAKRLLAASGRYILLGESEKVMSRSVSVSLDGEGLKRSSQVVGEAAAYSKEEPKIERIDAHEALALVASFGYDDVHSFNADGVLIDKIRKELDEIANAAP